MHRGGGVLTVCAWNDGWRLAAGAITEPASLRSQGGVGGGGC